MRRPTTALLSAMLMIRSSSATLLAAPRLPTPARPVSAGKARACEVTMGANAMVVLNDWFVSYPYASSFCVAALKASTSDLLAQTRERFTSEESPPPSLPSLAQPSEATFSLPEPRRVSDADAEGLGETVVVTCDEISCEDVAVPARPAIVWQRTLAFLLCASPQTPPQPLRLRLRLHLQLRLRLRLHILSAHTPGTAGCTRASRSSSSSTRSSPSSSASAQTGRQSRPRRSGGLKAASALRWDSAPSA